MFQVQFVKGTVAGEPKVTETGCMFYLNTTHNVADGKQVQKFFVNYKNTEKNQNIKSGDKVVFMGVIKGDEGGRPFIRENANGELFTVFDVETFRVYRDDEDFAFSLLVGNTGGDPDLRYTQQNAKLVASFSFATNEYKVKPSGQFEKFTIWWRTSAWENLADRISTDIKKGMKLLMFGVLNYDPQTGGPRIWERTVDGIKVPAANYEFTVYNYKKLEKTGTNGFSDGPEPTHQDIPDDVIPF